MESIKPLTSVNELIEKYLNLNKESENYNENLDNILFQLSQHNICYQCDEFPDFCEKCGTYENGKRPEDIIEVQEKVPEIVGFMKKLQERDYKLS